MIAPGPGRALAVLLLAAPAAACYRGHAPAEAAAWGPAPADWEPPAPPAAAPPAGPLDAEAVVTRAIARAPALLALRAGARAGRVGADAAGLPEDLELRLNELRVPAPDERRLALEVALRARPLRPGARRSLRDEAHLAADALDAEAADAARAVAALARRLHAELVLGAEEEALLAEAAAARAAAAALLARRAEAGTATGLDVALAELDAAEVGAERAGLGADLARARAELRALLDWPPGEPLEVAGAPGGVDAEAPAAPPAEALVTRALAARPALADARARAVASDIALWRARAARWPWLGFVQAGWLVEPDPGPWSWALSLAIDLPLGAWTGREVAAGEAEQAHRRAALASRARGVVREVEAAHASLAAAIARRDGVEARLLPAAERAGEALARADAAAAVDPLAALRVRRALLDARLRHLEARRAVVEAAVTLDEAVGAP